MGRPAEGLSAGVWDGPVPLATVENSARRLTAANSAFATLLDAEPVGIKGVDILSLVAPESRPAAELVLAGMASGAIDCCQARGRLRRRGDGADVAVVAWLSQLGSADGPQTLIAAVPADVASRDWTLSAQPLSGRVTLGTIAHDGRFLDISPDAAELFGWEGGEELGLLGVVHPEDVPQVLLALGRSSTIRRAVTISVRVRGRDDSESRVRLVVTLLGDHEPPRFVVALRPTADPGSEPAERLARLEGLLAEMMAEARSAGVLLGPADRSPSGSSPPPGRPRPDRAALTSREIELLGLAASGLSNRAIADELGLSLNTVRTHFQKVLGKLDAHSKLEAVAVARRLGLLRVDLG